MAFKNFFSNYYNSKIISFYLNLMDFYVTIYFKFRFHTIMAILNFMVNFNVIIYCWNNYYF